MPGRLAQHRRRRIDPRHESARRARRQEAERAAVPEADLEHAVLRPDPEPLDDERVERLVQARHDAPRDAPQHAARVAELAAPAALLTRAAQTGITRGNVRVSVHAAQVAPGRFRGPFARVKFREPGQNPAP